MVAKFSPSHGVNFWVRCASGNVYSFVLVVLFCSFLFFCCCLLSLQELTMLEVLTMLQVLMTLQVLTTSEVSAVQCKTVQCRTVQCLILGEGISKLKKLGAEAMNLWGLNFKCGQKIDFHCILEVAKLYSIGHNFNGVNINRF